MLWGDLCTNGHFNEGQSVNPYGFINYIQFCIRIDSCQVFKRVFFNANNAPLLQFKTTSHMMCIL